MIRVTEGSIKLVIKHLEKAEGIVKRELECGGKDQEGLLKIHSKISDTLQELESMVYKELGDLKKCSAKKVYKEQAHKITKHGMPVELPKKNM